MKQTLEFSVKPESQLKFVNKTLDEKMVTFKNKRNRQAKSVMNSAGRVIKDVSKHIKELDGILLQSDKID